MKSYLNLSNDDKLKIKEFIATALSDGDMATDTLKTEAQREMMCDKHAVETLLDSMKCDGTIIELGRKIGLKYVVGERVSHAILPRNGSSYDVWVCNRCNHELLSLKSPEAITNRAGATIDGYNMLDYRLRTKLSEHQCRR